MKKTIIIAALLFAVFSHADAATLKASTLRIGSTGENVKVVQQKLSELGYDVSVDGKFGKGTSAAVARFQASQNLKADGLCGDKTFSVILNAKASSNVSSTPISGTTPTDFGTKGDTTAKGPITITPDMVWARTCADGRPHLQIINPAGGEVYQKGGNITADWKDCNIPSGAFVLAQLYSVATGYEHGTVPLTVLAGSSNLTQDDGHELFNIPSYSSAIVSGQYKLDIIVNTPNNSTPVIRTLSNVFTIKDATNSNYPAGCSSNNGYSATTGQSCGCNGTQYSTYNGQLCYVQPVVDMCPNIVGVQTSVPAGMTVDNSGNCIALSNVDMCSNIAGIQTTVPAGMFVADGNCYSSQPVDPVCAANQSYIKIISPNGGEVYQSSQEITIKWKSCGVDKNSFIDFDLVSYSPNSNGYTGGREIGGSITNDGSETITLPNISAADSGKYFKIKLYPMNQPTPTLTIVDDSDSLFTINFGGIINPKTSTATASF